MNFLKSQIQGDILEIGTFRGGFLPILSLGLSEEETLFVNDIFEEEVEDLLNRRENQRSYRKVSVTRFSEQTKFIDANISILVGESKDLIGEFFANPLKLVHVDGSHLFENVLGDLMLSAEILHKDYGICILDDYRNMHAPGVAKAFWKVIELGELKPLVLGQGKAIMVPLESKWTTDMIRTICFKTNIKLEATDEFKDVMFVSNYYENLYQVSTWDKVFAKVHRIVTSLSPLSHYGTRKMRQVTYLKTPKQTGN